MLYALYFHRQSRHYAFDDFADDEFDMLSHITSTTRRTYANAKKSCVHVVSVLRARRCEGDPSCAASATGLARATMAPASIEAFNAVRVAN